MGNQWLEWARRIQAISQAGLTFSKDIYDIERYEELTEISAEILQAHTEVEIEKVKQLFSKEKGYQTPKIDVRAAVFKDSRILLVKEKKDQKWALPGGFCEVGLSPSENIKKEVEEESGFLVQPIKLLAVLDMNKHPHPPQLYHYYKLFIQCQIIGGAAETGIETNDVKFFSQQELPALSQARNTESQINMLFDHLLDPSMPVCLD
ncbi:NUDIX hydrolase [Metabacillus arenae]|uniref:NUDIX hydrolase n=1 Tax=Metabacillus arenae TaxID=2771434 RepID=A0A926RYR1_9BACI|nr:NUDIX hydrolase [Metabacillus arenae]MBD1381422.1 NUDIX hydrolase [Metabacillus arenae]